MAFIAPTKLIIAPAQHFTAPAQLITAPAQLITAPAQPPATRAAVYTALFYFWCNRRGDTGWVIKKFQFAFLASSRPLV